MIRCPVEGIRIAGRSTQGVIGVDTAEDEHAVSVEHIGDDGENGENGNSGANGEGESGGRRSRFRQGDLPLAWRIIYLVSKPRFVRSAETPRRRCVAPQTRAATPPHPHAPPRCGRTWFLAHKGGQALSGQGGGEVALPSQVQLHMVLGYWD